MTASAMGKAILATYSQQDLEAVFSREGSRRFTANTLRDQAALRADLEKVRADGYAVDDEELVPGLRCVASAVYNHQGEAICAISLSSLASRITPQRIPVLGRLLAETSAQLTAALSGEMPPVNAIAS